MGIWVSAIVIVVVIFIVIIIISKYKVGPGSEGAARALDYQISLQLHSQNESFTFHQGSLEDGLFGFLWGGP